MRFCKKAVISWSGVANSVSGSNPRNHLAEWMSSELQPDILIQSIFERHPGGISFKASLQNSPADLVEPSELDLPP